MNRNRLIGLAVAAAVLGILAFTAWSLFEIYPTTREIPPSREARVNEYLALDRWLRGMGLPVRIESSGDLSTISRAKEKQIFIQASLFHWTDEAVDYLVHWVEEGGRLFLVLDVDYSREMDDEEPLSLLEQFGIALDTESDSSDYPHDSDQSFDEVPDYDSSVSFEVSGEEDALTLKDWDNVTRLVQVNRGNGKLTVTGRPRFLLSSYLDSAPNAWLAWAVFAADSAPNNGEPQLIEASFSGDEGGWFFIRGTTRVRGLLGNLFRQGNLAVLGVSVLVLLVVGFWTVIPGFGLVRGDGERPGKPLRERFLAEGRFLKRYGALELYRDAYVREIKRRLARREGLSPGDGDEIGRRVMAIWGKPEKERDSYLLAKAIRGEPFKCREFSKMVEVLMSILERI